MALIDRYEYDVCSRNIRWTNEKAWLSSRRQRRRNGRKLRRATKNTRIKTGDGNVKENENEEDCQ